MKINYKFYCFMFIFTASAVFGFLMIRTPKSTPVLDKSPAQHSHAWDQVCEMCGSQYSVTPNGPNVIVPPTVEWCFNDGQFCDKGLELFIKLSVTNKTQEETELNHVWINHCITCIGCKCATFKPKEWHKIMSDLSNIRER